jgi:3,4-dihydroxy 2-butanone 4-phosphate synthase / GTP cyclohydrolase II
LRTEPLELPPTPFNLKYLTSKMEAGHTLHELEKSVILPMYPSAPVLPFKPHALETAMRFVYVASYFLPIRPIRGHVVLSLQQYEQLIAKRSIENLISGEKALVKSHTRLRGDRFLLSMKKKNFLEYQSNHPNDVINKMLSQPHWFRVHVYSDTVTSEDYVLLSYGKIESYDIPVVRLHSESVFSRFPLKDNADRTKFNAAIEQIVNYGCGILVLLYNDGRGAGFGSYAQDVMFQQRGLSKTTQQSYKMLGVPYDRRDYDAAITLLKHHLPHPRVQMAVNTPNSIINKPESGQALNEHGIQVENWIFLSQTSEIKNGNSK